MKKPKVLFLLKIRHLYHHYNAELKSSGLLNSAIFVRNMLANRGYETKLVQVVDANCIDREVTRYKPDIVIIEAIWAFPEKFRILHKLHPNVKWIIRVHSEIPFIAHEGMAMGWINEYVNHKNVYVSFNSEEAEEDFEEYFKYLQRDDKLIYLPNYYPVRPHPHTFRAVGPENVLDIGCFGAVRAMKNQLIQAFAAVEYCNRHGYHCRFHINVDRVESEGEPVLKNLRHFFDGLHGTHTLVEHPWLDRSAFLELIDTMDLGLQVSLSETFNIVAADFVSEGVPIVVSPQIRWMPAFFQADPTSMESIVKTMQRAVFYDAWFRWMHLPRKKLIDSAKKAEKTWITNLDHLFHTHHPEVE